MKKNGKLILCVLVILSIFIIPGIFYELLSFIKNESVRNLLSNIIYLIILGLIYKKEILHGLKDLKKNYKKVINTGFKYWCLGILIMVVSNLIINFIIFSGEIASNEELVRENLLGNPIFGIISACFIAPFLEELIFRVSLNRVIKNKYFYAITTGLIFGLLHAITDLTAWIDLIYIIPYGALGYCFGLMYKETDNMFTSIFMHMLHNTMSCILIFSVLG